MKSLVIGGAGFVGSYLLHHLRNDLGHEIYTTKMPNESLAIEDCQIYDLNILDKDAIVSLLREVQPDVIFHLAAQSSVALSWKQPTLTVDINIKGTINLLDAIRESNRNPKVLLVGSGEEYGHISLEDIPITETTLPRPGNIYAVTKVCQNLIGSIYANAYQMHIISVRAFNHIGPNQLPMFVVADFCKQVAEIEAGRREPVMNVGNLSAKRDFTDVRDIVKAYGLLIEHGVPGETYNIGSGTAIAIQDILDKIISLSTCPITVTVDHAKLRPVDVPIIEADTTKLTTVTGWKQEIPLERTIQETLDYWRNKIRAEE